MKQKLIAAITLDLEPDHAGYAPESYGAWHERKIKTLLALLKKHRAVLSIFVVTKTLKKRENIVKLFQEYGAEFYLHSHSHNIKSPDSLQEIRKGKEEFINFFKKKPSGYRAPGGLISEKGLINLKRQEFVFDASIIPSFWPKASYFFRPNEPFKDKSGILEIPFSTISPLRFVVSLSWIKLFGWSFYKMLFKMFPFPNPLIFSFHLHDLYKVSAFKKLPFNWRLKYIRNQERGIDLFEDFLVYLKERGYKFTTIEQVANEYLG